jgi:hypothetical protein
VKFAKIKNSEGLETIVSDTVNDSAGNSFVVDDEAFDPDSNPFVIFTNTVTGVTPRVTFVATSQRLCIA